MASNRTLHTQQKLNISAENKDALFAILGGIDIRVPPRNKGRTTEHCEKFVICRLLATFGFCNLLSFPLSLEKREKPDFLMTTGGIKIGVEVTEAIDENLAKAARYISTENGLIDQSQFPWEGEKRSYKEIAQVIDQPRLAGPGWLGKGMESEFARMIRDVTQKKANKLVHHYNRFDQDWLVIYDNQSSAGLEFEEGANKVQQGINSEFHKVIIVNDDDLVVFSNGSHKRYPVHDLWK